MKKFIALLLSLVLVLSLAACGGDKAPETTAPQGDAPATTPAEAQPAAAEKTTISVIAAQYGQLTATEEACEHCGAPMVIVTTPRGPWKLCPNFNCPGQEEEQAAKAEKAAAKAEKAAAKATAKSASKAKAKTKTASKAKAKTSSKKSS